MTTLLRQRLEELKRLEALELKAREVKAQQARAELQHSRYRASARPQQLPPHGDWRIWLILSGRGWGKALDITTPVPTPTGWTTMGELKVGDEVFTADGRVTTVTFHTGDQYDRPCYLVTFHDGSTIVADADHQWTARSRADRRAKRGYRTVTTADMLARVKVAGESNWQMPVAKALTLPEADLDIHPWVLGFWLGDGSSHTGAITVGGNDQDEVFALCERYGAPVTGTPQRKPGSNCVTVVIGGQPEKRNELGQMTANGSLHSKLKALGLLQNKHVPSAYLRASEGQRRDLLAGLIDSDGYVEHSTGKIEITTKHEHLAKQIAELVRSLGHRANISTGRATLNGKDCGEKYRVTWVAREGGGHLKRKSLDSRHHLGQPERLTTRYVASIEPVDSRPVCCITVADESSLYLAGEAMLVTHNTFTGAGWLIEKALSQPGIECAVVAPTFTDVRRTCVEGPSGIIKSLPAGALEQYNRSNGQITLANGSKIHMVSADEPDRARGLNLSYAWLDEFAAWRYEETWTAGLAPALRIGNPQTIITTTPRPTKLIREFMDRTDGSVVVTRGSTFDNQANLSPAALAELKARYEGTRLGRQELYGEVLLDVPGAIFTHADIEKARVSEVPELVRIVVAIDPAVTSGENSDETGIIVAGKGADGRGYILADRSCRDTPSGWAHRAVQAFEDFKADRIVAEKNQGGDMVESTIRSVMPTAPYKGIIAKQGKRLRAEPIAALYEQGRISHVGAFDQLEDQMTGWLPDSGTSPDRLDALVHALTELGLAAGASADRFFAELAPPCPICGMPVQAGSSNCPSCGARNNDYDLVQVYPRR